VFVVGAPTPTRKFPRFTTRNIERLLMVLRMSFLKMVGTLVLLVSCSSNHNAGPVAQGTTGLSCTSAQQCYPGIDAATLQGGVGVCMSQFPSGYCTHLCATDTDCCAIPGECPSGYPEVCGPFESTGKMYCFLSCEDRDVTAAGLTDTTAYCQTYANRDFICRSTGGGSQNRKVCVPNG